MSLTRLRFTKQTVYDLKRRYGFPITVVRQTQSDIDPATGLKTTAYLSASVDRAVVLPAKLMREAEISVSGFPFGGKIDTSARIFLIEKDDVPFEMDGDDYIIFEGDRWDVVTVESFEKTASYIVVGRHTTNASPISVTEHTQFQEIFLNQTVSATK